VSVIDDIYNGELYPAEQVKPCSDAFHAHAEIVERLSERLESLLNEEQRGVLEEYKSETAMVTDLYNLEFYRAGVKLGIQLLLEALDEETAKPDAQDCFGTVEPAPGGGLQ